VKKPEIMSVPMHPPRKRQMTTPSFGFLPLNLKAKKRRNLEIM